MEQTKFQKSKKKNKKYMTFYNGKWISFGDRGYQHYKDQTGLGLYSKLDHNDEERGKKYRARHREIMFQGKPAYLNKNSPEYYSWNYLW